MNIYNLFDRGIRLSGGTEVDRATERTRQQWLDALLVDETRAWMSLGERQPEVLSGLAVLLTLAGMVQAQDLGHTDTPENRVIRGALSACEQCALAGSVITPDHARALSSACRMARGIVAAGSRGAIKRAAANIRALVG